MVWPYCPRCSYTRLTRSRVAITLGDPWRVHGSSGDDGDVDRLRGWPVTLTEGPVGLRPLRLSDMRVWRDTRLRNADWLRPWEPSNPETPLFRTGLGPYYSMTGTLRREARQGLSFPWVLTYEGRFAGQLTVGAIVWGSARSALVGYWIDKTLAGRGVVPTALAMAVDHCFFTAGLHRVEANIRPENVASRR